jgi:hypothetical protein
MQPGRGACRARSRGFRTSHGETMDDPHRNILVQAARARGISEPRVLSDLRELDLAIWRHIVMARARGHKGVDVCYALDKVLLEMTATGSFKRVAGFVREVRDFHAMRRTG